MEQRKLTVDYLQSLSIEEQNNIERAPHLDLSLLTKNKDLKKVVDSLILTCDLGHKNSQTIQLIVENLIQYQAHQYLAIPLRTEDYKTDYKNFSVNSKRIRDVIQSLEENGFIEFLAGNQALKLISRIKAKSKLQLIIKHLYSIRLNRRDEQLLILKDEEKNELKFKKSDDTDLLMNNIKAINNHLSQHNITLHDKCIYPRFRRIFNDRSWARGGRFYDSSYQQLSAITREQIKINNEEAVELDYSNIHLNILYAQKTGRVYDGDAYTIPGLSLDRPLIKVIVQVMLNTTSRFAAVSGVRNKLREKGIEANASSILTAIESHHSAVSEAFYTKCGAALQFIDSQICEQILLAAARDNVCVLAVHDSFIAQKKNQDWLLDQMNKASKNILNVVIPIK